MHPDLQRRVADARARAEEAAAEALCVRWAAWNTRWRWLPLWARAGIFAVLHRSFPARFVAAWLRNQRRRAPLCDADLAATYDARRIPRGITSPRSPAPES